MSSRLDKNEYLPHVTTKKASLLCWSIGLIDTCGVEFIGEIVQDKAVEDKFAPRAQHPEGNRERNPGTNRREVY